MNEPHWFWCYVAMDRWVCGRGFYLFRAGYGCCIVAHAGLPNGCVVECTARYCWNGGDVDFVDTCNFLIASAGVDVVGVLFLGDFDLDGRGWILCESCWYAWMMSPFVWSAFAFCLFVFFVYCLCFLKIYWEDGCLAPWRDLRVALSLCYMCLVWQDKIKTQRESKD